MTESEGVRWHRDADTSLTIRLCWALGVGTLFAALSLMVFGRFFALTAQTGGQSIVVAAVIAVAVTILALAVAGNPAQRLASASRYVPGITYTPGGAGTASNSHTADDRPIDETRLKRGIDAAVGAVVMGALIFALDGLLGGNVGEMLAAATIPLALCLLLVAVFLRSTGVLDREDAVLYLYNPEEAIDLDDLESVSTRYVGDSAVARLRYRTPDGEYVPGPRRLVLPPGVARELEAIVDN